MHPRRLEKNANITLKSALLRQAVFRWWERSGPMGSKYGVIVVIVIVLKLLGLF
jgi:hypothetical protein